jgi:hypothetical protein
MTLYADSFTGAVGVDTGGVAYPLGDAHLSENPTLQWNVLTGGVRPNTGSSYDAGATCCCGTIGCAGSPDCTEGTIIASTSTGLIVPAAGCAEQIGTIEIDCNRQVFQCFGYIDITFGGDMGLVFLGTCTMRVRDTGTEETVVFNINGVETTYVQAHSLISPIITGAQILLDTVAGTINWVSGQQSGLLTVEVEDLPDDNTFGIITPADPGGFDTFYAVSCDADIQFPHALADSNSAFCTEGEIIFLMQTDESLCAGGGGNTFMEYMIVTLVGAT